MNYYIEVLKKYAVFSGRATRAEYWYFYLFNNLIGFVIGVIVGIVGTRIIILFYLYFLALLIPGWAVAVRRLHDIGKSGWWVFISGIPIVGSIWLIVLKATDSTPGENKYGPNPKGVAAIVAK